MFCLLWAQSAFEFCWWFDFANRNSVFYSMISSCTFGIAIVVILRCLSMVNFTAFALPITLLLGFYSLRMTKSITFYSQFHACFAFFGLLINFPKLFITQFANRLMAIFSFRGLMKINNRLNHLASPACFCYNWFRHDFFLIKKLCLEPLQGQSLCGLFYNNEDERFVK